MFKKLAVISVLLVILLGVAATSSRVVASPLARPRMACSSRMWLTPHSSQRGWRNWLEGSSKFNGSKYIIVNMREHRRYRLNFWGNFDGHARFGVSKRWAWSHPWWKHDPWLLLYNCR